MILQQTPDGVLVIAQSDHAKLAGALAARWGGEALTFEPWEPFIRATARHDDGWIDWDAGPPTTQGYPLDFISAPTPQRVEIYRRGIEMVADEDPWTVLLVSMHLTGLFKGRYEPQTPSLVDNLVGPERQMVDEFIEEEEERQAEIREQYGIDPMPQYRLLQLLDRLSLTFCLQQLPNIGKTSLELAPLTSPRAEESVVIWWEAERIHFDPHPFSDDEFDALLPVRLLPNGPYANDADYARLLAETPVETVRIPIARAR